MANIEMLYTSTDRRIIISHQGTEGMIVMGGLRCSQAENDLKR